MITSLIAFSLVAGRARHTADIEAIPAASTGKVSEVWGGAISNSGYVTGGYRAAKFEPTIFPQIWSEKSGSIPVAFPDYAKGPLLFDVNDKGIAVGEYTDGNSYKAFTWSPKEGFKDLPQMGVYGRAMSINNRGDIAGITRPNGDGHERGLLLRGGKAIELKPLEGYLHSYARAINEKGQTVGRSYGADVEKPDLTTVWDAAGHPTMVPLLEGARGEEPTAINDKGEVVGVISLSNGLAGMFLYSGGKTIRLPDEGGPSIALGLNNKGQIVGATSPSPTLGEHAFLCEGGKLTDLNELLPPNSGWFLERAISINDRGEIVGDGFYKSRNQAFLLRLK